MPNIHTIPNDCRLTVLERLERLWKKTDEEFKQQGLLLMQKMEGLLKRIDSEKIITDLSKILNAIICIEAKQKSLSKVKEILGVEGIRINKFLYREKVGNSGILPEDKGQRYLS